MNKLLAALAFGIMVVFTACDKDSEVVPQSQQLVVIEEDQASIDYVTQTIEEMVDETIETRDPGIDCPEITFAKPRGVFPNTITFDFGVSCEMPNGHILSGKIVVNQTAPMKESGAIRTTSFENFYVDHVSVAGTKVLENITPPGEDGVVLSRTVNVELTFPDGTVVSRSGQYTITQTAGYDTPPRFDDSFEITGSGSGTTSNGTTINSVIMEPLVHSRDCKWISDGLVEFEITNEDGVFIHTLDYGYPNDGECDKLALVTLDDGTEKEITIHRRRW